MFQDVARLAVQSLADRLQGGESHSLGLSRLEDGKVRRRDPYPGGKFVRGHLSLREHDIYVDYDRHRLLVNFLQK